MIVDDKTNAITVIPDILTKLGIEGASESGRAA
jgi:hypothetical protein